MYERDPAHEYGTTEGLRMNKEELKNLAEVVTEQYISAIGYRLEDEIEYLLESSEVGSDAFDSACHIVFGFRYTDIFLAAQHSAYEMMLWLYNNRKKRREMTETDIMSELDLINTWRDASRLSIYFLEKNSFSPIEPIKQKNDIVFSYAELFCKHLDPHNKCGKFLDYMRRDHSVDDFIFIAHSIKHRSFADIAVQLGLSREEVRQMYFDAKRFRS